MERRNYANTKEKGHWYKSSKKMLPQKKKTTEQVFCKTHEILKEPSMNIPWKKLIDYSEIY